MAANLFMKKKIKEENKIEIPSDYIGLSTEYLPVLGELSDHE